MSVFPPRILETLLRSNEENLTITNAENQSILDQLEKYNEDWTPTIHYPTGVSVKRNEVGNFQFYYDNARFSPYSIHENYTKSSQLLKELTLLQKEIKAYQKLKLELVNERESFITLKEINVKERALLEKENNEITQAEKLKLNLLDRSPRTYLAVTEVDPNKLTLKLEIDAMNIKLAEKELARKEELFANADSPYSVIHLNERARASFVHKTTELAMLIEALKHGFYVMFDIQPAKIITLSDINSLSGDTTFEEKLEWFKSFENLNDKLLISIEKYLWAAAKVMQEKFSKSYTTVEYVKLDSAINDDNEIKFTYDPFSGSQRNSLLKGISVEFIYKDDLNFKNDTSLNRPYHTDDGAKLKTYQTVDFKNKNTQDKIRINVIPPFQRRLSDSTGLEYEFEKRITFYAQVNRKDVSSLRKDASDNTFYGTNILKNINPEGKWKIELPQMPSAEIISSVDQVAVYFHQTLY